VDLTAANAVMAQLETWINKKTVSSFGNYKLALVDHFNYLDPVDSSVSKNQGIRFVFECGSRIIFRLSGTGTEGATLRLYIDQYEPTHFFLDTQERVASLVSIALEVSDLVHLTGRLKPTVIT
jgi:phosphoglucomutase